MATAVTPVQLPPHSATVEGGFISVISTRLASLLPLFATTATPMRGSIATPSGADPTGTGAPTVPTAPALTQFAPGGAAFAVRATIETVPSPEFVTAATSQSVSIATANGDAPTVTGWTTIKSSMFEITDWPGFCTYTA